MLDRICDRLEAELECFCKGVNALGNTVREELLKMAMYDGYILESFEEFPNRVHFRKYGRLTKVIELDHHPDREEMEAMLLELVKEDKEKCGESFS